MSLRLFVPFWSYNNPKSLGVVVRPKQYKKSLQHFVQDKISQRLFVQYKLSLRYFVLAKMSQRNFVQDKIWTKFGHNLDKIWTGAWNQLLKDFRLFRESGQNLDRIWRKFGHNFDRIWTKFGRPFGHFLDTPFPWFWIWVRPLSWGTPCSLGTGRTDC